MERKGSGGSCARLIERARQVRAGHSVVTRAAGGAFGSVANTFRHGNAYEDRLALDRGIERGLGGIVPRHLALAPGGRRLDLVELTRERQDVEERVEQRVAHFLNQI